MAVPLPHGVDRRRPLLELLAAGEPRSLDALAQSLDAPAEQISGDLEQLRKLGLDIAASPAGYRLAGRLELLDAAVIRAALGAERAGRLHRLEVLFEVDSTNTRLLERRAPPVGFADAALAELQNAGRGRQGRRWVSPFGASLALSLGWTLADAEHVDASLSLAVGVAVCRALGGLGARDMRLKWPNDVWLEDRKLGGVLVETRIHGDAAHLVIGVGLNLHLSDAARSQIDAPQPAALEAACPTPPSRNAVAAALLGELLSMLPLFERCGFAAFREEWRALDALYGRAARVLLARDAVDGIARGVDEDGGFLLEYGGKIHKFIAGEASLRLIPGEA